MATLKSFPWLRERIRIHLTQWGYDVQVYGQTVMRSPTYREATRFAVAIQTLVPCIVSKCSGLEIAILAVSCQFMSEQIYGEKF